MWQPQSANFEPRHPTFTQYFYCSSRCLNSHLNVPVQKVKRGGQRGNFNIFIVFINKNVFSSQESAINFLFDQSKCEYVLQNTTHVGNCSSFTSKRSLIYFLLYQISITLYSVAQYFACVSQGMVHDSVPYGCQYCPN